MGALSNSGMLMGIDGLSFSVADVLNNQGRLLSERDVTLTAATLSNDGQLLAGNAVNLTVANQAANTGVIQGKTLAVNAASLDNQGDLTGVSALTLTLRDTLANTMAGRILTQGTAQVNAAAVTGNGLWQAETLRITANEAALDGVMQTAALLQLDIQNLLNIGEGGSLTSSGELRASAAHIDNRGSVQGKSTTLTTAALTNAGTITGAEALTLALTDFTQTASGQTLSGGQLVLDTQGFTNAGRVQGGDTRLSMAYGANSGAVQGVNLALISQGDFTHAAGATLLASDHLTFNALGLFNQGLMQGNNGVTLTLGNPFINDGKVLSGGDIALTTPQMTNNGTVQGDNVWLTADGLTNSGTWLAARDTTLSLSQLTNSGLVQGAALNLNVPAVDNSGTLFATQSLSMSGNRLANRQGGKLYTAGDLSLTFNDFTSAGDTVALGNLTLNLVQALRNGGVLAAGKVLAVNTRGAVFNDGTLQGQGIALVAGGGFTNRGTITGGSDAVSVTAQDIALTQSGSLQSGGDVTLSSRGAITNDGFTGTAGNLVLSAAGQLTNTALLYAAGDMKLFADSIQNLKGDILAGNSLWMQRDAAGNANSRALNSSGTIETQRGDIFINTALLENKWESLTAEIQEERAIEQYPWVTESGADVPVSFLPKENYGYGYSPFPPNATHFEPTSIPIPYDDKRVLELPFSESSITVTATGGTARIASGRNLHIFADTLENQASSILAQQDISLSGNSLNNQSWASGKETKYQIYIYGYGKDERDIPNIEGEWPHPNYYLVTTIFYTATGQTRTERTDDDGLYRSVIQAGGSVVADFTRDISNTVTQAHVDNIAHEPTTPILNTLKTPDALQGGEQQILQDSDNSILDIPAWNDLVQDTLKDLGSNNAQIENYPLPNNNNGLFVTSSDPDSPYLITTNPKLDGLGLLDDSLFDGLYSMLGLQPGAVPREVSNQYTNEKAFLGSSYFMDRLNLNPDYDYRFLGDAAFDTRYISNAMLQQTGSRYINGVGSDLEQMEYLINSAVEQQVKLGLQFGISLTAEQVANLTKSIVWWESVIINGQTVMVPKLYLAQGDVSIRNGSVIRGDSITLSGGDIANSGSTIQTDKSLYISSASGINNLDAGLLTAGTDLNLSAIGNINNISSTIGANRIELESVTGDILNLTQTQQRYAAGTSGKNSYLRENITLNYTDVGSTGVIQAADSLTLRAGNNITITGAELSAGSDMTLKAGNDISLAANALHQNQELSHSGQSRKTEADSNQRSVLTAGENLTVSAGRDLNADAAAIVAGESAGLMAGRDVNLNAAQSRDYTEYKGGRKQEIDESIRQQGTEIASGADTTIVSGRDINTQASQVQAGGDIALSAGRDVNLSTATESDYHFFEETKVKKKLTSSTKTHIVQEDYATREAGTLLSGDNVKVSAGNDLKVTGSQVVGDGNVALNAGNNVTIEAATEEESHYYLKEKKKSGLFSGGGLGFTVGTSSSRHQVDEAAVTQSQSASTIGSTGGDVSITAGNQAKVSGSDLIANQNLSVTGGSVVIDPGHDAYRRDEKFEQKTSGLTVALSGAAGSALNTAVSTAQDAKKQSDGRLAALTGTKAALSGVQAGQAVAVADAKGEDLKSTVGIGASLGSQKSSSESHHQSDTVSGSTLSAGNNLSVTATGKGSGAANGDILIGGSQLKAGGDTTLSAERDVLLAGAANTQETTGKNSSSGFGVGVDVSFGKETNVAVSANANKSKGSEKGNGTQWTETTVDSGKTVSIISGRDTTLAGAQVSGEKVVADVGRDLTLSSQQDSDYYDSTQSSVSGGVSVPIGSGLGGGLQLSGSRDKLHSNYDSVQEQTGIYAGEGGFDITVGKHTQLDGAVIASTADESKNRLDTGTLGFSDIDNKADFKTEHQGGSFSTGSGILGNALGNAGNLTAIGGNNEGHASGTTQSAVSGGSVVIRDEANQKQDITDLSRDPENANGSIAPIFDKEKEQNRLKEIQLIGEIGAQVGDVIRTQGQIETAKALNDPQAQQAAKEVLAGLGKLNPTEKEINDQISRAVMETYGTGSSLQKTAQAVTGILTGLAGGDIGKALAGGASPYIAEQIKKYTGDNDAANVMAHAVWGAIAAEVNGNSGLAGAAGVTGGELAARYLAEKLYPGVEPSQYSEEQKQTLSALGSLAAGMAGGIAGGSTANTVAGAQAGQNAINNNLIGGNDETQTKFVQEHGKDVLSCATNPGGAECQRGQAVNKAIAGALVGGGIANAAPALIAAAQSAASTCASNPPSCAVQVSNWVVETIGAEAVPAGLTVAGISKLSSVELAELKAVISMEKQLGSKATKEAVEGIVNNSAVGKGTSTQIVKNSDGLNEVKIKSTPLEGQDRLNTPDLGGSGKLKPAEAATAAQLEPALGQMERYTPPKGATSGTSPDFVITSGPNKGKTVDAMYTTDKLSQKEIDGLNKFYEKNMSSGSGKDVIQDHLKKADFVPVDFRVLTRTNQKIFMDYIKTLPKTQQDKIIIMR
ncbi:hemagglutinin repeat-containing protein [Enterobacillus tribolii]|nr:hemagglutinin repeat-containing protein [Enterobacillus tribolii]